MWTWTYVTPDIVLCFLGGITKDLVRGGYFLKSPLALSITGILVGVIFLCKLSVRVLDLVDRSRLTDAEYIVIVAHLKDRP